MTREECFAVDATLVSVEPCGRDQVHLTLAAEADFSTVAPGRFFMVYPGAPFFLGRPFGVAGLEAQQGRISFLVKVIGEGTQRLAAMSAPNKVRLNGPFGNTFSLEEKAPYLLLAGGIGIAPILYLAETLAQRKIPFHLVYGARSGADLAYKDKLLSSFPDRVTFATDDGSLGFKGNALMASKTLKETFGSVHACGPTPLLRAAAKAFPDPARVYLSLEERMACGFGACNGCAVEATPEALAKTTHPTGGKYLKICTDGPIFRATDLVW